MKHQHLRFPKLCLPLLMLTGFMLVGLSACATNNEAVSTANSDRECRRFDTLGSKMKRSECRSKEEWALIDEQTELNEVAQAEFFRKAREGGSLGSTEVSTTGAP